MITITIRNAKKLSRLHFENLAELRDYLITIDLQDELQIPVEHQKILDERLEELQKNPDNFVSFAQFKKTLKRKNV